MLTMGLSLAACGGAAQAPTATATPAASDHAAVLAGEVTGEGAGAAASDCSTWPSWVKVNAARFASAGHSVGWVDVYVEEPYVDAYRSGGEAPVGMRIVKAGYADADATTVRALTVMGKMPAGYDPDGGDWYYGVLAGDGRTAKLQGRLAMCRDCHDTADVDFRFGRPTP